MGLTYSSVVDADLAEVFSWHTRPGAIMRLTAPWRPAWVLREAGYRYDPPNAFAGSLASLPLSAVLPWRHALTIAVTGSGGLIGTALTALLTTSGHRVSPLFRPEGT